MEKLNKNGKVRELIRGVNCSCTRLKICPDSAPGALTK